MKRDNSTLKTYFETGDYPTESQFIDLIDSFLNIEENDAVTGITNNGDDTYTFQLLSGGTEILNLQSLPDDIPIASVVGLQALLDTINTKLNTVTLNPNDGQLQLTNGVHVLGGAMRLCGSGTGTSNIVRFRLMESNCNVEQAKLSIEGGNNLWLMNSVSGQALRLNGVGGFEFFDGSNAHTIWHSGNDGSGSGLNADTVDGIQASSFLRSDANDSYNGQVLTMGYGNKSRIDFLNNDVANQSISLEYEASDSSLKEGGYAFKIKSQNASPQDKAHLEVEGGVYGEHFSINNANTKLTEASGDAVRLTTPSGFLEIGPKNTSHCHFYTDRSNFWFEKEIRLNTGTLRSHNGDVNINRNGSSTNRLRITASLSISDQNFLIYGRSAQVLSLRGSSNNANTPCYARFERQDGTDRGYIGYGSSSNSNLSFVNQEGTDCILQLKTNGEAEFNNNVRADNFILSSDKRLKTNIKPLSGAPVNTNWVSFQMKGEMRLGVIAQELEEHHPEFVRTDEEGYKSVAYIDLLVAKNAELEARIEKLEKLIEKLS